MNSREFEQYWHSLTIQEVKAIVQRSVREVHAYETGIKTRQYKCSDCGTIIDARHNSNGHTKRCCGCGALVNYNRMLKDGSDKEYSIYKVKEK